MTWPWHFVKTTIKSLHIKQPFLSPLCLKWWYYAGAVNSINRGLITDKRRFPFREDWSHPFLFCTFTDSLLFKPSQANLLWDSTTANSLNVTREIFWRKQLIMIPPFERIDKALGALWDPGAAMDQQLEVDATGDPALPCSSNNPSHSTGLTAHCPDPLFHQKLSKLNQIMQFHLATWRNMEELSLISNIKFTQCICLVSGMHHII